MSDDGMELSMEVGDPEVVPTEGTIEDHDVPEEQRLDEDALDPDSVANRDGEDLWFVNPDEGELIDLEAMG